MRRVGWRQLLIVIRKLCFPSSELASRFFFFSCEAKDRKAFEINHKKIVIFMYEVSRIIVEHLFIEMHFKFYEFIFNCLSFITF